MQRSSVQFPTAPSTPGAACPLACARASDLRAHLQRWSRSPPLHPVHSARMLTVTTVTCSHAARARRLATHCNLPAVAAARPPAVARACPWWCVPLQWRVARRRYASALPHCKFIVLTLSVAAWCVCACPAAVPCLRYLPICLPTRPPSALICASFFCLSIFPPACHPPVCLPVLACPRMVLLMALLRGRTYVTRRFSVCPFVCIEACPACPTD